MKYADESQMQQGCWGYGDDNPEGIVTPLFISDDEVDALLAEYDPDNQYSPSATVSRDLARAILDALRAFKGLTAEPEP